MKKKKKVVVFGIFDGVHEGHRSLFAQAREHGQELIAVVGRDAASLALKLKKPRKNEQERRAMALKEKLVDYAVLGDKKQSVYSVAKELNPDVICLGYDQEDLRRDLESWMQKTGNHIPLVTLKPYKPKLYHTSLMPKGF